MDVLADYPWPDDVRLDLRPVKPKQPTNAGLHRLAERPARRVCRQAARSARAGFERRRIGGRSVSSWPGSVTNDKQIGEPITAYVPAGESRVVRVPRPLEAQASQRLRLSGDDCDFDNTLYLATRPQAEMSVVYLGTDAANDAQGPRYYLERAVTNGLSQPVELVTPAPEEPLSLEPPAATPLVVVTSEPTEKRVGQLKVYVEAGGTVLVVLTEDGKQGKCCKALLGVLGVGNRGSKRGKVRDARPDRFRSSAVRSDGRAAF